MNRLVIIGNGFDLAHKLKTSYKDFIYWYLDKLLSDFFDSNNTTFSDYLIFLDTTLMSNPKRFYCFPAKYGTDEYLDYKKDSEQTPLFLLNTLRQMGTFTIVVYKLLDRILTNVESKGWTDIESDYYYLLKRHADEPTVCKELNNQMDCLRNKLAEYLDTTKSEKKFEVVNTRLIEDVVEEDVAQKSTIILKSQIPINVIADNHDSIYFHDMLKINDTMILDFNYTSTTNQYKARNIEINHIHGSLLKPEEMIFGYGDEMDKDFQELIDKNDNELLKNMKSVKYLETSHYRNMLQFINGGFFQVYIMGHSCGNSDRTLLNTIFEHENCVSIKPFCYINEDGKDNYSELTQNIYRNFKDKTLFRDRVVNKEQCTTLDGNKLV